MENHTETLQLLPSVEALLQTRTARAIASETGAKHLTNLARGVVGLLRKKLIKEIKEDWLKETRAAPLSRASLLLEAEMLLADFWRRELNRSLKKVINATGVVAHTNLGRAPLSEAARRAVFEHASRYCNLEYNLQTGKRGRRGENAERLLAEITGAEAALVVNNCAAAAFLVMTVFAAGGEVVISRGELVEIGGDFRVPDVLEQSGARLREVGATNRTRLADYESAINEQTRMILRVHPSNYRIVGFTATPALAELAELARRRKIMLVEDAGSGALLDLSAYGLTDEPIIQKSVADGADLVTFSGDKLLGGAQAGLIVGRREAVERIRRHPLYRALRVDKLIYAALEATLESFRRETALEEIPVLKMLSMSKAEIEERTLKFAETLYENLGEYAGLRFEVTEGNSVIGGGSAPTVHPATVLLALEHAELTSSELEEKLRASNPPVIARILEDKVLLDLRTVSEAEAEELLKVLTELKV